MSTLVVVHLLFLVLLSNIAFIFTHATKATTSNSLVLSLTRPKNEFPTDSQTQKDELTMPLTEIPDGFVMSLALGTPSQIVHRLFFDTGSDLVWVPCDFAPLLFHCIGCNTYERDSSTIFNPRNSHSIERESCSSRLCVNVHTSASYYDTCTIVGCSMGRIVNDTCSRPCPSFAYTYGGGAVAGVLASDILDTTTNIIHPINITFGCVQSTYRWLMGIVGFGKGPLSLPSQLGFASKGFSHCFLPYIFSNNKNVSTPLILGDLAISSDEPFQYTPMLNNPMYPYFYYVGLESITVGTTKIRAPTYLRQFDSWGNGGMIMDSGTTYTRLPEQLYWKLISTLESSVVKYPRSRETEQIYRFDLCYVVPTKGNNTLADDLPSLTFHFLGGVSLALPHGNTFYEMRLGPVNKSVVKCFLFQPMDDAIPRYAAVFGNAQQLNVKVVYDMENERVGFLATDCLAHAKSHGLAT